MKLSITKYDLLFLTLLLILFTATSYSAFSQSFDKNKVDSLIHQINHEKIESTEKINYWNQIAVCYIRLDLDSTAHYANEAKNLSTEIGYKKGLAISILSLAEIEQTLENYDKAIPLFNKTIELYEGLEKDANYLRALILLGIIYEVGQDFDKALEYYMTGLREAQLQGNKPFIAYFNNNISIVYGYTGFHDKELIYIKKASEIFKELGDDNYYANSLLNIGAYYQSVKQLDTALFYFHKAEKLQKKNNNYYGLTNIYNIFGDISLKKNNLDKALNFYQQSLLNALLLDSLDPRRNNRVSRANLNFGNVFLKSGKFLIAKKYFHTSKAYSIKSKSLLHQEEASYGLFSCFFGLNKHDSAMYYHGVFLALNDSLIAESYNERIDKLNYKYALENEKELFEKENELITLQKNRQELLYLIIVGILFIVAAFIFLVWYFQKAKLQRIELIKRNLQLENENYAISLEKKNRELTTTVLNLIERNEFLSNISKQLKESTITSQVNNANTIEEIIKSIDKESVNKLWKEFEARYMDVHKDFHNRLTIGYPKLTANERRLCAFIVLNLSSKDISSITYQSLHSIKIARYRLRKKLGLEKNENLTVFLHNL